MDKKVYNKPVMVAETFTPNNYVSTCDWWKAEATGLTSSTYYYDVNENENYDSGEEFTINAPSTFYFKLSDSSNYITQGGDGQPSSLSNNVNDNQNYYTAHYKQGQNQVYVRPNGSHSRYTNPIYKIVGYPSKGASTSATYWYTSANLTFDKAAS